MEFAIYFVLILALASLAGFMLHARFSSRRDKALHHAPLSIAASVVAVPAPVEDVLEVDAEAAMAGDLSPNELPAIKAESIAVESKEDERKSEYLDELQEAAAGLAMLMRSSASNRPTPVVFAPEGEEVESVEPAEVEVEAEEESPVESATAIVVDEQSEDFAQPEKKTLEMLLGAEVTSQFGRIDSGLDELEALVSSIECGLTALAPFEPDSDSDEATTAGSEMIEVSEAA